MDLLQRSRKFHTIGNGYFNIIVLDDEYSKSLILLGDDGVYAMPTLDIDGGNPKRIFKISLRSYKLSIDNPVLISSKGITEFELLLAKSDGSFLSITLPRSNLGV